MNFKSDQTYALVMLVFSLFYGYQSFSIEADFNPVNEKFYPFFLSLIMAGLSLLLIIFPSQHQATWPRWYQMKKIALLITLILVYSLALKHVGFLILATLLMAACMWLFGARPNWIIGTSVTVSTGFYLIFDRLLGLNLPAGVFTFPGLP